MPETLNDLIQEEINQFSAQLRVCMPAKVMKYDHATHLAIVQPLIKRKFYGKIKADLLPTIANVPVIHPRSENGMIKVPVSAGSIVTLIFADRSIESWVSGNGGAKEPGDTRKHHFNDAFAIPGGYPKLKPWATPNHDALEIITRPGTKIGIGNGTQDLLQIASDAFSSLKDLADELSATLANLQLETHTTTSPGAPTSVPLNATSYAATKTTVDGIAAAVNNVISELGLIKT